MLWKYLAWTPNLTQMVKRSLLGKLTFELTFIALIGIEQEKLTQEGKFSRSMSQRPWLTERHKGFNKTASYRIRGREDRKR